ncbi:MAG: hypothetical protein ACLFR1_10755 [Spirochaetia bacterium]
MAEFDLSPIEYNIQSIAFNLFRRWIRDVERRHPRHKITIIDEGILVQDLKENVISALNAIRDAEKQSYLGWAIGFFYGFLGASLGSHWFHEYIKKLSNEYRIIVMLQAVNKQLMQHKDFSQYILQQYQEDIQENCNFHIEEIRIQATMEAAQMQMEMPQKARLQNALDSDLFTCLNNIITQRILRFTNEQKEECFVEIQDFIPYDAVSRLFELNDIK